MAAACAGSAIRPTHRWRRRKASASSPRRARSSPSSTRCVHRVGTLEIGELAVWVGVSAAHRGAAFDACRYVIDEVKKRVPIWKNEHYADGESGWLHPDNTVVEDLL